MAELSPSSRRAWIEILYLSTAGSGGQLSPSSRRAWIEIRSGSMRRLRRSWVALLAEGVDRNKNTLQSRLNDPKVALLAEGVDRN